MWRPRPRGARTFPSASFAARSASAPASDISKRPTRIRRTCSTRQLGGSARPPSPDRQSPPIRRPSPQIRGPPLPRMTPTSSAVPASLCGAYADTVKQFTMRTRAPRRAAARIVIASDNPASSWCGDNTVRDCMSGERGLGRQSAMAVESARQPCGTVSATLCGSAAPRERPRPCSAWRRRRRRAGSSAGLRDRGRSPPPAGKPRRSHSTTGFRSAVGRDRLLVNAIERRSRAGVADLPLLREA